MCCSGRATALLRSRLVRNSRALTTCGACPRRWETACGGASPTRGDAGCHWQLACQCVCLHNGSRRGRTSRPWPPGKPAGVIGAESWVKVGDRPPAGPGELSFLSVDTRTPYVVDYRGEDGGKTAHYMRRWLVVTSNKGPSSETASATIGPYCGARRSGTHPAA